MTARTKKPDAFGAMLVAAQAIYEEEIRRLADLYRPRILAGEFSGCDPSLDGPDGPGGTRYLRLDDDLNRVHPWLSSQRMRLLVIASSRWLEASETACKDPKTGERVIDGGVYLGDNGGLDDAGACMAHDILAISASRGWVKPMRYLNEDEAYALRIRAA